LALILSIYFIELFFQRRFKSTNDKLWSQNKISLEQFILLITDACFFIRLRPSIEDLTWIFQQLDTDHDGFITFQQYADFIRKYLGRGIDFHKRPEPKIVDPKEISEDERRLLAAIWGELKRYFDLYGGATKGFLVDAELKKFVIEVLHEESESELNYIFWNLFRVDEDSDRKV